MTRRNGTTIGVGIVLIVIGGLVLLMGRPSTKYRDVDGYYIDEPFTYGRSSRAIVTDDTDILQGVYEQLASDEFVLYVTADPGELRLQGTASGTATLFMGIAPSSAVDGYLADVAHDEISDVERHQESKKILDVRYTTHEGTRVPTRPSTEAFWLNWVEGTGLQTLDWEVESGDWTAVIMNADGSSGVTAELAFGAAPSVNVDAIRRVSLIAGAILVICGGLLLFIAYRRRDSDSPTPPDAPGHEESAAQAASMQDQHLLGS
jgi:hypothetical protein